MRLGPSCNETQSHYTLDHVNTSFPGQRARRSRHLAGKTLAAAFLSVGLLAATGAAGCSATTSRSGIINAVGAENEYANVLGQIGGRYVQVSSVLNNPNTDPHTFEASTSVAREVSDAQLIVQNGVGYDSFMNDIESASPNSSRKIIVAQHVLRLPDSTPNPHLWYNPKTMPAVARVMTSDLSELAPSHRAYFQAKLQDFDASLKPWFNAIAAFKAQFPRTPVATTEPVADYLLSAMGMRNLTPFVFQADIMNGVDPAPQDISLEKSFFTKHTVKLFCYNQQVVDSLTTSIRQAAQSAAVPVVGVYETMPTPGYNYQSWMLAEVAAIRAAVVHRASTEHL
jgi:zinc/manganese transport system substrate-binding protein